MDWRALRGDDVAPLLASEMLAYRDALGWDVSRAWSVIEPARAEGRLPGFVAVGTDGEPRGWTCFVPHRDTIQVATLVASGEPATARLVRGILRATEAARADLCTLFVRDAAPGLPEILRRAGFDVARYRYLSASVRGAGPDAAGARAWTLADFPATADLLRRAYAGSTDVRAFAPNGTREEWREYLASLVAGPGCGQFQPAVSRVAAASDGAAALAGAVLTTELSDRTAHLAQVVVDPAARGRGLARALIDGARRAAAGRGARDVTLLVAESNRPAAQLYASLGFRDRGVFVAGMRRQPRRSTSVALATGGVSTRR
ncbi:MAG: GNAT family N-acetyltransferase [Vicinamibacterales bacterium]